MIFFYSVMFGAGAAAFIYTKMGRRIGYGNEKNVWTVVGVTFVMTSIFFATILWTLGV